MKSNILIVIIFAFLTIPCLAQENKSVVESHSIGKVKGAIFDMSGEAVIPNMKVIVEGGNLKRTIATDDKGEYEIDLPVGTYNITTEQNWYFPVRRASFKIQPATVSFISIYPTIYLTSIALEITKSGVREPKTYAKKPKYDTFSIPQDSSLTLVVEFSKKINRNGIIEYKNAKLTYDNMTIIAEEVWFDKSSLQIQAKGLTKSVLIDSNGQKGELMK